MGISRWIDRLIKLLIFIIFLSKKITEASSDHQRAYHLRHHANSSNNQHQNRLGEGLDADVKKLLIKIFDSSNTKDFMWYMGPYLQEKKSFNKVHDNPFDCKILFKGRQQFPPVPVPPKNMPTELRSLYTMDGKIPVQEMYFAEVQNGASEWTWSEDLIETKMKEEITCGTYKNAFCGNVIRKYGDIFIRGKSGAVIGSQSPWAEAALLGAGASHITTVEYNSIFTNHSKLSTLTPQNYSELYQNNQHTLLDFIWVYSSIEHDGLGRYGDPLNPFGDMEAIAKIHCMLKRGGVLFIGFPVGADYVTWNAHRIYGRIRLNMLLHYWMVLDIEGPFVDVIDTNQYKQQPVFVLKKRRYTHKI